MDESEVVLSTEVFAEVRDAMKRFRNFTLDHLQAMKSELSKVNAGEENRRQSASLRVSVCQDSLDAADEDDDLGSLKDELRKAEGELERIERAKRHFDELAADYQRRAVRLLALSETNFQRAISMLYEKEEAGHQLRNMSGDRMTSFIGAGIQMMVGISDSVINTGVETADELISESSNAVDLTSHPLPSGYCWMPLTELDLEGAFQDVKTPSDFRSLASYETMKKGLETLKDTVLPMIASQGYAADSFSFMRADRRAGLDYEHGSQRVFDTFFGRDAIALQPSATSCKLTVIDGRHRIKAAYDAGWMAVPAKVPRRT